MEASAQGSKTGLIFLRDYFQFENSLLKSKGFLFATVANLIWGTSFLASKITLNFWGPFTASVLRFTIAIGVMLLVLPLISKSIAIPRNRKTWLGLLAVGVSGFGFLYPLQLKGLTEIPSSLSACIMLTSPLFVLLLTAGVFREQLSQKKLIAIAIGIFGGTLLINPTCIPGGNRSSDSVFHLLKGTILTVLASISLAVSVLATRSVAKELDSFSITFWSMMIGLFLLLPFAIGEPRPLFPTENPAYAFGALFYLAVICSVLAFLLWNRAISMTSPQNLASTMHIKTPVAVVAGVMLGHEPITLPIILGTLLISYGVALSQNRRTLTATK